MSRITQNDFSPLLKKEVTVEAHISHASYWKKAFGYLTSNKGTILSFSVLVIISVLAIISPISGSYNYETTDLSSANIFPNKTHWFGTDTVGRDLWIRVWLGARTSLLIGLIGAILPQLVGIVIGSISGYVGGLVDSIIMAIVDIGVSIPSLVYITLITLFIGAGPVALIMSIAISSWMEPARVMRSRMIQFKNREFVLASQSQGASSVRIILKHICPNILGQLVISVFSAIPTAIFLEAYLSFIGLGIGSPMTSLGQLCKTGVSYYRLYPYQLFIPGAVISVTILALYVLGNSLRDALDFHLVEQEVRYE